MSNAEKEERGEREKEKEERRGEGSAGEGEEEALGRRRQQRRRRCVKVVGSRSLLFATYLAKSFLNLPPSSPCQESTSTLLLCLPLHPPPPLQGGRRGEG